MDDNFVAGVVLGVLAGLLAVAITWVVRERVVVPRVSFSDQIQKREALSSGFNKSGWEYRFAMQNVGTRKVIDLRVRAILRLPIEVDGRKTTQVMRIPLLDAPVRDTAEIAPLNGKRSPEGIGRRYFLHVNLLADRLVGSMYEDFHEKVSRKTLTLEDLLGVPGSWLQLTAFGFDQVSGVRKLSGSPRYTIAAVAEGEFHDLKVA